MQAFTRRSLMLAQPRLLAPAVSMRAFSTKWQEKERGEEKSYFSKQDAKLLKKLVEKMEARDELESETVQEHCAVTDDLEQIFSNNGLSKDGKDSLLWQELMEWKRTKY